MEELPKVKFRVMSFKENIDLIAMFFHSELNYKDKSNINYFKNKFKEINLVDFSNMNREEINNTLQKKLKNLGKLQ